MGSKLLKEWAIVCKALGDGRQIFIARKGGISEAEGEFVVENREFFLLPTYLHQSADQLDPRYRAELELVGREEPRDGFLPIGLFARVTDELPILRPEPLRRLEHIWNPKDKMSMEYIFLKPFCQHASPLISIPLSTARAHS